MKDKFQYIFIAGVLIGIFFLGRSCGVSSVDIPNIKIENTIVHDTIWPDTTIIYKPKHIIKHDTVQIIETYQIPLDSLKLKAFFQKRHYERSYKSKDVEISVDDTIIGYLLNQGVSYKLFKPLSIVNSTITSIKYQDTITKLPKWQIKGGIDLTPKNLYIGVDLQISKDQYGIAYDPINKQFKVLYRRTLFKSKK